MSPTEDNVEKALEEPLSKPLKAELRTHPLLYVIAVLFIGLLFTAVYFGVFLQKQQKTLLQNQTSSQAEQNRLIRLQLDAAQKREEAAKKLAEDALKKPTSPSPSRSTIVSPSPSKPTAPPPVKTTCDETAKQYQIKKISEFISQTSTQIRNYESDIRILESLLSNPKTNPIVKESIPNDIKRRNTFISDGNANIAYRQQALAEVEKCNLRTGNWELTTQVAYYWSIPTWYFNW